MARKRSGEAVPLNREASGRYLPLLVAIMVYLAALALAGAISVNKLAQRWDTGLSGALTVQIPADSAAAEAGPALDALVASLRASPGVESVAPIDRQEMSALLEPWLGESMSAADLPLPRLVAITLKPGASPDSEDLRERLQQRAPGSLLEDHQQWLARLLDLARAVEIMAAVIVVLVVLAASIMVAFVTRMGLAAHDQAIELLHLIGAQDSYVARQFQSHALSLGLRGGVIGLLCAMPTLYLARLLLQRIDSGLLPELTLQAWEWSLLFLLPLAAALVSMVTARLTVLRTLSRMP